jgi:hypothetical protein
VASNIEIPDTTRDGLGQIKISRCGGFWADGARKYRLRVDGRAFGAISPGDVRTIDAEPGSHRVQLRLDWCRSPVLEVHVPVDGAVGVRCWPNGRWYNWPYLLTIGRQRYIALELEN